MGIDPFASTYQWLQRAWQRLKTKETIGWYRTSTDSTNVHHNQSLLSVLNEAYCEILLWNPKFSFPEVNFQSVSFCVLINFH